MSNGNPFNRHPPHQLDMFPAVWDAMHASERQSPTDPNRHGWGQVFTLQPNNSATNTVDAVLRYCGVVHVQPFDGVGCILTLQQTRSMVQWQTGVGAVGEYLVPPWGLAFELPGGWTRVSIRPIAPPSTPLKFACGVAEGPALRHWIADAGSPITIPAGGTVVVPPVPFARRVTVSVIDGDLLAPSGSAWLGKTPGVLSLTLSAGPVTLIADPLAPATVDVTWEVVA